MRPAVIVGGAYLAIQDELMPGIGKFVERRAEEVRAVEAIAAAQFREPRPSVTAKSRCPSCLISFSQSGPAGGSLADDTTRKRISAGSSVRTAAFGISRFGIRLQR